MILLVGARQDENMGAEGLGGADEGFVYFIDPNDASIPSNPESQRIYRIPYRELLANISPLAFPSLDHESSPPTFFIPYAYCRG